MPYIYENDPTKIGTNLQTAAAYLLSLHKNEYEWNLLGIKVVGVKEALPIPDGNYEYGDAYMIGNEADGYEMWIYTRADEVHAKPYWFNVGAFPKPGPQGPKGDGWETVEECNNGTVQRVDYDTTHGARIKQDTTIEYTDKEAGSSNFKTFPTTTTLPILPGKYISMDANSNNDALEVKVDDTALALDYIKIDKAQFGGIPVAYSGKINWYKFSTSNVPSTIVYRDAAGNSAFNKVSTVAISTTDNKYSTPASAIYFAVLRTFEAIPKTATDTGTLTVGVLTHLQRHPSLNILYDNKTYYRMDPADAPNGTLNYIHIDSVQDGNGRYKATGKCFRITVSTREWKVVDLDFARSYTHKICVSNQTTNAKYYFTLVNNKSTSYRGNAAGLISALSDTDTEFQPATRSHSTNGIVAALLYRNAQGYLVAKYGTNTEQMTANQIVVSDQVV